MLFKLIIAFTVLPFVEISLLVRLGKATGIIPAAALVIGTGVLGAILARHQGLAALGRINREISRGEIPALEILDGVLILCGGILFITPGLLTDLAGIFFLVRPFRLFVAVRLRARLEKGRPPGSTVITVGAIEKNGPGRDREEID